ncbi:hypothetical protein [Pseudonocardia sp. WMMC193]|uniref:hypothetical protein n=1 Tax=Pseudonocardia sp. WMMC193 TaxID=2911965 RepID=UPI001F2B3475|nr:hypothetical protein [Pseudonocardia sp. WMMC193]MCF7550769.1 hypothetical protein [Pseudonocardia sp. WMMC193]
MMTLRLSGSTARAEFGPHGPPDAALARLKNFFDAGADAVVVGPATADDARRSDMLELPGGPVVSGLSGRLRRPARRARRPAGRRAPQSRRAPTST